MRARCALATPARSARQASSAGDSRSDPLVGQHYAAGRTLPAQPRAGPPGRAEAGRFFLHYFSVEILFGVPNHFGVSSDEAVRAIADILRHGMLRPQATAAPAPGTEVPATIGS